MHDLEIKKEYSNLFRRLFIFKVKKVFTQNLTPTPYPLLSLTLNGSAIFKSQNQTKRTSILDIVGPKTDTDIEVVYENNVNQILIEFQLGALKRQDLNINENKLTSIPYNIKDYKREDDFIDWVASNFLNSERTLTRIQKFEHSLLACIKQQQNIKFIAEQMAVSQRHLHRIVKSHTGISPKKMYNLVLLHNVIKSIALKENLIGLKHISHDLNFYDMSHFNKFFRNTYGISPKKFLNLSNHIALEYYKNV